MHTPGAQRRRRDGDARREAFGGHRERWQRRQAADHRTDAGLELEQLRWLPGACHDEIEVAPARTLFARATVQPTEVPTVDRCVLGFFDQGVEPVAHETPRLPS